MAPVPMLPAAAHDDMAAAMDRPQTLHPHPLRAGQPRGGEHDKDAGEDRADQHQHHRGRTIERLGCDRAKMSPKPVVVIVDITK